MRYTATVRNAKNDAIRGNYNNGYLRIYSGTRPTDGDTALSGNTLLVELRYAATAFPASSGGVLTANAITGVAAVASGTATFARSLQSDGTTVIGDASVTATGGGGEIQLATTTITAGVTVSITALTVTEPVGP